MNRARAKTKAAAALCCGAALLLAPHGQAEEPAAPAAPAEHPAAEHAPAQYAPAERAQTEDAPAEHAPAEDVPAEDGSSEDGSSEDARPENPYVGDTTWEVAAPPADPQEHAAAADTNAAAAADTNAAAAEGDANDELPRTSSADVTDDAATEAAALPPKTKAETPQPDAVHPGAAQPPPTQTRPNAHRVTAIALTGLTFIGMGVGTSYAIQATSQSRQADALGEGECAASCRVTAERLHGDARRSATVAQVAFAIGLVSLGGAAYLWLTDSSPDAPADAAGTAARKARTGWQLDVSAAPGGGSAWLAGTF